MTLIVDATTQALDCASKTVHLHDNEHLAEGHRSLVAVSICMKRGTNLGWNVELACSTKTLGNVRASD